MADHSNYEGNFSDRSGLDKMISLDFLLLASYLIMDSAVHPHLGDFEVHNSVVILRGLDRPTADSLVPVFGSVIAVVDAGRDAKEAIVVMLLHYHKIRGVRMCNENY
jgi:hypothetical protein